MNKNEIFNYDPIITDELKLREKSRVTTMEEVIELNLVARLRKAACYSWTGGCGLAAIQIGIPVRFAVFKWGEQEFILLNPEIIEHSGKFKPLKEGCLSIPNKEMMVPRYYKIKYISDGVKKTAKGLKAQIIQHEIDHMDGVLNIDTAVNTRTVKGF